MTNGQAQLPGVLVDERLTKAKLRAHRVLVSARISVVAINQERDFAHKFFFEPKIACRRVAGVRLAGRIAIKGVGVLCEVNSNN